MKRREIYNAWKEAKRQIDISEDFSSRMLNRIHQYERERRKSLFDGHRLIELISAYPFAKAGLIAAGAVIGLVRIMFVVYAFLGS
jgi:hypothetical protein